MEQLSNVVFYIFSCSICITFFYFIVTSLKPIFMSFPPFVNIFWCIRFLFSLYIYIYRNIISTVRSEWNKIYVTRKSILLYRIRLIFLCFLYLSFYKEKLQFCLLTNPTVDFVLFVWRTRSILPRKELVNDVFVLVDQSFQRINRRQIVGRCFTVSKRHYERVNAWIGWPSRNHRPSWGFTLSPSSCISYLVDFS